MLKTVLFPLTLIALKYRELGGSAAYYLELMVKLSFIRWLELLCNGGC